MKVSVERFSLDEFRCPCCGVVKVSVSLALLLDILRKIVAAPLVVSSGYRCLKHNFEVGGVSLSRHIIGCAADILCPAGVSFDDFYAEAAKLFVPAGGRCLEYRNRNFLHLAVPRSMSVWLWDGGAADIPPGGFQAQGD